LQADFNLRMEGNEVGVLLRQYTSHKGGIKMIKALIWEAKCPFCRTKTEIKISAKGYENWIDGDSIQTAFPDMPAEDRELLVSGICYNCQEKIFTDDEEDDDDDRNDDDDCYNLRI